MKKTLKLMGFLFILNWGLVILFIGVFSYSVVFPSLKESNITVLDIIKNDVEPLQKDKLEVIIAENNKKAARKIVLTLFGETSPGTLSDMFNRQGETYTVDEVLKMNVEASRMGMEDFKESYTP